MNCQLTFSPFYFKTFYVNILPWYCFYARYVPDYFRRDILPVRTMLSNHPSSQKEPDITLIHGCPPPWRHWVLFVNWRMNRSLCLLDDVTGCCWPLSWDVSPSCQRSHTFFHPWVTFSHLQSSHLPGSGPPLWPSGFMRKMLFSLEHSLPYGLCYVCWIFFF